MNNKITELLSYIENKHFQILFWLKEKEIKENISIKYGNYFEIKRIPLSKAYVSAF